MVDGVRDITGTSMCATVLEMLVCRGINLPVAPSLYVSTGHFLEYRVMEARARHSADSRRQHASWRKN